MFGFILLLLFGIFFSGLFVSMAKRKYVYKKTGTLLEGEVSGHSRTGRYTRCDIRFCYNRENRQMTSLQSYRYFSPPQKGAKVPIYYTEKYNDHVYIANQPEIVSQIAFLLFGLAFAGLGIAGLLGYIPYK